MRQMYVHGHCSYKTPACLYAYVHDTDKKTSERACMHAYASININIPYRYTDTDVHMYFWHAYTNRASTSVLYLWQYFWMISGERTFGVLTKIDLMDKGTDAVDVSLLCCAFRKEIYTMLVQNSHEISSLTKLIARKAGKLFSYIEV